MSASPQNIGATIAFLRKRKGITQRVLADSLNVTDKAVSRWERGIGIPDQSLLVKLADVLGVDVESILAGEHASVADDWRGVLLLEYPNGMGPETLFFDRPALELQLGYLMLTGLRDIAIVGRGSQLEAARCVVAQLPELGVVVSFVDVGASGMAAVGDVAAGGAGSNVTGNVSGGAVATAPVAVARAAAAPGGVACAADLVAGAFDSFSKEHGTVLIDGIDFLYGKDLTRALWRFMTECKAPLRVVSHTGTPLHMRFFPAAAAAAQAIPSASSAVDSAALNSTATIAASASSATLSTIASMTSATSAAASTQQQKLCRGVVAFPIASAQDALDASTLISILSRQQGEPFMDLPSISRARGFIE